MAVHRPLFATRVMCLCQLKELARAACTIDRYLTFIIDGGIDPDMVRDPLRPLDYHRKMSERQLKEVGAEPKIDIHPNVAELYRRKFTELNSLLTDDTTRQRATEIIHSLIDRIEVHPGEKRGKPKVILVGALASILEFACAQTKTAASTGDGGRVLVVAGARSRRYLHVDHAVL